MKKYFDPATNGFLVEGIHEINETHIELTDDEYNYLREKVRNSEGFFEVQDGKVVCVGRQVDFGYKIKMLEKELHNYIYSRYNLGTQSSMQTIYISPETTEEQKSNLELVWEWIKSVMVYYYSVKTQLENEVDADADFSQFDSSDPGITLRSLLV